MRTICLIWMVAGMIAFGQDARKLVGELDPFDPLLDAPIMVRVRVEHIELDHRQLTKLLMDDKSDTTDATALRMKVQTLVEKDEAKVIDTQVIVCQNGRKATVESIQEVIYPTEYYESASFGTVQNSKKAHQPPPYENNPAIPTSFETRNTGSSLEVEAAIFENSKWIEIRIVPEMTWYNGQRIWHEEKDTKGNASTMSMPDFYITRFNTSFACRGGQYFMAGVASPKNAKGELDTDRKVMLFVKSDILPVAP